LGISRRRLLALGAGAAGSLGVARAASSFYSYYNAGLQTQTLYQGLLRQAGYRPVSVSIYGNQGSPSFAAVWAQRSGPDWRIATQVDAAGFQAFFDSCARDNYRIVLLSAMGSRYNPSFIAAAEKSSIGIPLTRHLLASGSENDDWTIQYWLKWARQNNQIPRALAIYGSAADPGYAVAFEPNTANVLWNADGLNETFSEYQARFDAQWLNYARPAQVHVASEERYLSLFRGDQIVGGLVARHGMTTEGYQSELNYWTARGCYPIFISAGGSGSGVRFAALFAGTDAVKPRGWTPSGPNRSAQVDGVMSSLMRDNQIRHASLAVFNNKTLIFARAYTAAEDDYPVVTPTSYFRVASCSKTLTAMLIVRLIQENRLALNTTVQSILNLTAPMGKAPKDSRFSSITVSHLLSHRSGLQNMYAPASVAAAFGIVYPVTQLQTAQYAASLDLLFAPGTNSSYSSFGFDLLGMMAAKILGVSYLSALLSKVFYPLGASRVRIAPILAADQPADEAKYDSSLLDVGKSVVTGDGKIVPRVYGADFDSRVLQAGGGLSVAAPDFAKVLASLNVRSGNPVLSSGSIDLILGNSFGFDGVQGSPRQAWKGGLLWGLSSTVNFVEQGISYVVCCSKDNTGSSFYPDFPALRSAVANTTWPSQDLFPTFGIPSF
jgi:CubicO group peptidase (beta-lactamase class C family)